VINPGEAGLLQFEYQARKILLSLRSGKEILPISVLLCALSIPVYIFPYLIVVYLHLVVSEKPFLLVVD
jgi:hypothetical protein